MRAIGPNVRPLQRILLPALARHSRWIAAVLILAVALTGLRREVRYYEAMRARSVDLTSRMEIRAAGDMRRAVAPRQLVVTDAQFVAGLADRSTPSLLVDTSTNRILAGYLSVGEIIDAARQSNVSAILFLTEHDLQGRGDFYMPQMSALHGWVARHFRLARRYRPGEELWTKK